MKRMCKYSCSNIVRALFEWHRNMAFQTRTITAIANAHTLTHMFAHRYDRKRGKKNTHTQTHRIHTSETKRKMNECASLNISVNLKTNYGSITQSQQRFAQLFVFVVLHPQIYESLNCHSLSDYF